MRGTTIATHVSTLAYEGITDPKWTQGIVNSPWLDGSAVLSDDGIASLVVVNAHPTQDLKIELDGMSAPSGEVTKYVVTAETWEAMDTLRVEQIGIEESMWDVSIPPLLRYT